MKYGFEVLEKLGLELGRQEEHIIVVLSCIPNDALGEAGLAHPRGAVDNSTRGPVVGWRSACGSGWI